MVEIPGIGDPSSPTAEPGKCGCVGSCGPFPGEYEDVGCVFLDVDEEAGCLLAAVGYVLPS